MTSRLSPSPRIAIVTPVLDDWLSLNQLMADISALPTLQDSEVTIVAVDDGSAAYDAPSPNLLVGPIKEFRCVRLKANLSHQRAIALGLAYVERDMDVDMTIVMDSDGEDRPADLERLISAHNAHPTSIIVARRRKRSEGLRFKLGYAAYKFIFTALTGKAISFGNFSLIPGGRLQNVVYNPNIWNSFAATLLRSRVPIQFVESNRGARYFGRSHMNFSGLVVHGMSAISVFSDVVITRLIIALAMLTIAFICAVAGVIAAKLIIEYYNIPGLFLPGYATNLILSLANLMVSASFIGLVGILSLLASRVHAAALPSQLLEELVSEVDLVSAPELRETAAE